MMAFNQLSRPNRALPVALGAEIYQQDIWKYKSFSATSRVRSELQSLFIYFCIYFCIRSSCVDVLLPSSRVSFIVLAYVGSAAAGYMSFGEKTLDNTLLSIVITRHNVSSCAVMLYVVVFSAAAGYMSFGEKTLGNVLMNFAATDALANVAKVVMAVRDYVIFCDIL